MSYKNLQGPNLYSVKQANAPGNKADMLGATLGILGAGSGLASQYYNVQDAMSDWGPSSAPAAVVGGLAGSTAGSFLGGNLAANLAPGVSDALAGLLTRMPGLKRLNRAGVENALKAALIPTVGSIGGGVAGAVLGSEAGAAIKEEVSPLGPIDSMVDWTYKKVVL